MRKIRFPEHQIIAVIKSVEAGRTVRDVYREADISEATYYIYGLLGRMSTMRHSLMLTLSFLKIQIFRLLLLSLWMKNMLAIYYWEFSITG